MTSAISAAPRARFGCRAGRDNRAPPDRPEQARSRRSRRRPSASSRTPRISAIAGGATTAPTAVPALMMPMAVERSRAGNHSATAFVAAGNPPPSPIPSRNRLDQQRSEAGGEAVAGAGQRPEDHDEQQAAPRAERVDQRAAARVHQRVGERGRPTWSCENLVLVIGMSALDGGDRHRAASAGPDS